MLTPNELEAIPEQLVKIFRQLELDVMNDIIERIAVNKDISRTADWEISRLYELGVSKRAIKKRIKDALKLSTREINLIYKNVIWQDYARYEPIYRTKGKPWIPYEKNRQLQQLVSGIKEQTLGEFKNITQSLGFAVKRPDGTRVFQPIAEYYQKTLDNAATGMLSGVYDYNTMIKKAVRELTESGLRTVDYETGRSNRVEVAARRALMTGFNQVVAKVTEENAEKLGTDKFEVTYHRGARPTHQPWQGRVYTKEQLVTVCGYGAVDGLKGANCYHDFHPFFDGISKRLYTDEELDKWNAEENTPKQYGDKEYTTYEALQRQRRIEMSLRRRREEISLLEKGGAGEDDILAAKAKYHGLSNEYAEFSKAMGLPQQRERISVDGRKGVDVSFGKPTAKVEKSVANPGESGIISLENGEGMYRKSEKGKIEPMPKKQFHRLEKSFKRRGGIIQYNQATDDYLATKHAEGITYDSKTILLKRNPGRASVFEELIHAHQYRTGKNDGSYLSRLNSEIDAQKKLIRHSSLFQLTQQEIEQTKSALESYKKELEEYYNRGGK